MKQDILKAIEKEKEYLSYRMEGIEPFHLVDVINECGFESLKEYFVEKSKYYFNQLQFEVIEKKPPVCLTEVQRLLDEKITGVLFVESDETFVFSGTSKGFNKDYCLENNIPIYYLHTGGGTIVSTAGDFSIGICFPEYVGVDVFFILSHLKNIFGKYMDGVTVNGNDLLVNGEKICGSTRYAKNGMICFVAHISFKDNSELIEKICNISGSIKPPTFISGLSVATFKEELRKWLNLTA